MSKGVERFRRATSHLDLDIRIQPESTHTAEEAAAAVGAPVGAIVKSLVFVCSGTPILLLVSGPNRVNAETLEAYLGAPVLKADADLVKDSTGFSIGGVPPFGHPTPLRTLMDEDLFAFDEVWAAAGSQSAVFPLSPQKIQEVSGAEVIPVR